MVIETGHATRCRAVSALARDADIADLRRLHAALDAAILACYGWDDLDPGHDFHPNARGQTRFGMAPDVQRAVVQRLLDLNLAVATGRV